jgi:hypothetical protein
MRKLAVAVLFGLTTLIAHAQSQSQLFRSEVPVVCGGLKQIIEEVTGEKYQEVPFWNGIQLDTKFIITVNRTNKSWTIIQYNEKGLACILGSGEQAQLIFPNASDL